MTTVERTGIMFTPTVEGFPTLAAIERVEPYVYAQVGADAGDAFESWHAIAVDPNAYVYADNDVEAMDRTNWDELCNIVAAAMEVDEGAQGIPHVFGGYRVNTANGIEEAIAAGVAIIGDSYGRVLAVRPAVAAACAECGVASDDDGYCANLECIHHNRVVSGDLAAEALDEAQTAALRLADYPLLDEDAYSALEFAAWQEYAPIAFRDELRDAVRDGVMSDDEADAIKEHVDELLGVVCNWLDHYAGFSGEYGPPMLQVLAELRTDAALTDQYKARDAAAVRAILATEEGSATFKQALKHSQLTAELEREADSRPQEAAEAVEEVEQGRDTCSPCSYVARELGLGSHATPTAEQIKALRDEAGAAGDEEMVSVCDRALAGDAPAIAECARVIATAADASADKSGE